MTRHKEWFSYLEKPKIPGVVSTGDDTPHPIANVGEVPLSCVGQKGKLMNVLHVSMITQNLVSIGEIFDQGMEVRFTHLGAFIEEEGWIIARGRRDGRMSSSTAPTMAPTPLCSRRERKPSRISTCGTSG
jgi:hypothetical protein